VVGDGQGAMTFPEKPGLTGPESDLVPYNGPRTFLYGIHHFENCLVTGARLQLPENSTATVTFHNCKFLGDDYMSLQVLGGRIEVDHSLFDGSNGGAQPVLMIEAGGGSVRFNEFVNDTDYIRLGSDVTVEWNYLHQALKSTATADAHSDGIEVYGGGKLVISNNYIDIVGAEGQTGAINLTNDFSTIDGVRVEGNTLMGGTYSLYIRGDGNCHCGGDNRNIEVIDNRWIGTSTNRFGGIYGTHSYEPPVGVTNWAGNTLLDGNGRSVAIPVDNPQPEG